MFVSDNAAVAQTLASIADLLDLAGERFKPEAYRRAARSVEALPEPLSAIERRGELEEVPGIGEAIAEKIREFLRTGRIAYYDRLRQEFPPGLLELMRLPGIGPKTARRFWTELGVVGPADLSQAIEEGRLDSVKGFGPKKIGQFRAALATAPATGGAGRTSLLAADAMAREIIAALRSAVPVQDIEVAGSLRRRRESVGDLDVLATSPEPERVLRTFTQLPSVAEVKLAGGTKATVLYGPGMQVDLRVVEPKSFGAALQYFTGSKDHNIHLRTIARDQGYKINEYGVFRGETWVSGRTEEEVYGTLGLDWMPPEIRENQGEIEAASLHQVPKLVAVGDLRGLLHVHLSSTVTVAEVDQLANAASRRWSYLGIVIAGPDGSSHWTDFASPVQARLVEYRDRGAPIRVLFAREGSLSTLGEPLKESPTADFSILHLSDPKSGPPSKLENSEKPWLAAHPARWADTGSALESLHRLGAEGSAIEITPVPGQDGFDSAVIRQWTANGRSVAITPGGEDPLDERRLDIAVGVARRGWTTPDRVLNGRSLDDIRPAQPPVTKKLRRG